MDLVGRLETHKHREASYVSKSIFYGISLTYSNSKHIEEVLMEVLRSSHFFMEHKHEMSFDQLHLVNWL